MYTRVVELTFVPCPVVRVEMCFQLLSPATCISSPPDCHTVSHTERERGREGEGGRERGREGGREGEKEGGR